MEIIYAIIVIVVLILIVTVVFAVSRSISLGDFGKTPQRILMFLVALYMLYILFAIL
jgi:hypothetical protein